MPNSLSNLKADANATGGILGAVRILASILLILFIGWICLDPLFCPDGCAATSSGLTVSPVSVPDGCCILCHAAVGFESHVVELFQGPFLRQSMIFIAPAIVSVPISRIDHPPRT
jgi:hypothetical protein